MLGCEKCVDGKVYAKKEPIGHTFKYCDCYIEYESLKRSEHLFKHSNLPLRQITDYTIEKWKEPEGLDYGFLEQLISLKSSGHNWLFLEGNTGSGKTHTAVIAAQIALLREKSVYFTTVADLLRDLRPNSFDEAKANQVMEFCRNAEVLILDDIGQEKASDWVREQLYIIINGRWNDGKITIFTSNFPIEHLQETVGQAVYSRVKGDSLEITLQTKNDKRIY